MKVEGSIRQVLSDWEFMIKSSYSKVIKEDYSNYEKPVQNKVLDNLEEGNDELEEGNSTSFNPMDFLNIVNSSKSKFPQQEDFYSTPEEGITTQEEVHGVYLDLYVAKSVKETASIVSRESEVLEPIHGIYLDLYKKPFKKESSTEEFISGSLLDSDRLQRILDKAAEKVYDKSMESLTQEKTVQPEDIYSTEGKEIFSNLEVLDSVETYTEVTESALPTVYVRKEIQQVSKPEAVPSSIRDYIKKHQGSTLDSILSYYSKKDLNKAVSLGKIYKKNGKYYV